MAGSYRLLAPIGGGGTATVFAALDPLGAAWAVKVQAQSGRQRLHRIFREYQLQAWIEHPSLVPAMDVGVLPDGRGWIALERVLGSDARRWVRDGSDPVARALHVACEVAVGLGALHDRGVVHADIKPSNLLVEPTSRVRILDLGLAQWTEARWEQPGHFGGTPAYASPEQLRREPLTPASDVFSLAATVYALVGGSSPFAGTGTERSPAPPLAGVPADVARLLLACLSDAPDARPSLAELRMELALYGRWDPPGEPPPSSPRGRPAPLGPASQQLVAMLAIAAAPLELYTIAVATEAAPVALLELLEELQHRGLTRVEGSTWSTDGAPPERAPWTVALAEGLLGALDPAPSLARAHALLFLGRDEEAAAEATAAGRVSERLRAHAPVAERLVGVACALEAARDVTLLDVRDAAVWAALGHPGHLAAGFDAARRGDAAGALRAAAEAPADTPARVLLEARALALQGRHSAALASLRARLRHPVETLARCLCTLELAALELAVGRVRVADDALRGLALPERPPAALLARRARVRGEVDCVLGRPLDAARLREARAGSPLASDARVLAALELLARANGPDDDARRSAATVATAPGDDLPDLAYAAALCFRARGGAVELPAPVEDWLARPGTGRFRIEVLASAFHASGRDRAAFAVHARRAAAALLPCWSAMDRQIFELQPWWQAMATPPAEDFAGD